MARKRPRLGPSLLCTHSHTLTLPQTITDLTDKFEPPTMAIENTWRFIPIAGGWAHCARCLIAGGHAAPGRCVHAAWHSPAGACGLLHLACLVNLHQTTSHMLPTVCSSPSALFPSSAVWSDDLGGGHRAARGLLGKKMPPHCHLPGRPAVAVHRPAHAAGHRCGAVRPVLNGRRGRWYCISRCATGGACTGCAR